MKLVAARVRNYRSVRDTGWFDVEEAKTILVGPNEAGKTAVLEALQQINPSGDVMGFDALRDYPRKLYNADVQSGHLDPNEIPVASARFTIDTEDLAELPEGFAPSGYEFTRYLGGRFVQSMEGVQDAAVFSGEMRLDLQRLAAHVAQRVPRGQEGVEETPRSNLDGVIGDWNVGTTRIAGSRAVRLGRWLDSIGAHIDERDIAEVTRHSGLLYHVRIAEQRTTALATLKSRMPVFVYFNNYFQVRPNLHLRRFADRVEQNLLDDDRYDYGNVCLLKLLGFDARELGKV